MADSKFILYIRKFLKNPLLERKQMSLEIINPESGQLTKQKIADKLAKTLNVKSSECITIFGMKAKFGGGRTSAFALVYDSVEAKTKFDSLTGLRRAGIVTKKGRTPRKGKKEIKGRRKRVHGTAKSKCVAGKQKKR